MKPNEMNFDELLVYMASKSYYEKDKILNEYVTENHDKMDDDTLQRVLTEFDDVEELLAREYEYGSESYDITLNDQVFIKLWRAKLYIKDAKGLSHCKEMLDGAEDLMMLYDETYCAEMRKENQDTLVHLRHELDRLSLSDMQAGVMPAEMNDYLELLEKKRIFSDKVNTYVGHVHHYGYLLMGNSGTGKRTAARQLYQALHAIEPDTESWVEIPAIQMFDPSSGFTNINDKIDENKRSMIYISGAEDLSLKGLLAQNGIEILSNKLKTEPSVTVVLSGPKNELIQLVNSCQAAKDIFLHQFTFDDYSPETLTDFAVSYADRHGYVFTPEAREKLYQYFSYEHKMRGSDFGNIHLAHRTIDDKVLPHLIARMVEEGRLKEDDSKAQRIEPQDIPEVRHRDPQKAIERLESLVGLENIKKSIMAHASLVNLNRRRMELGLFNHMPPMHMVFTGNPGTGKTTVAELIGEIYHGMGVLSSGHLVEVDRSKLVGQFLGDTEKNTLNAIKSAAGGVLFIDEAYNLFTNDADRRDFGHRVIETLLTYLSMEKTNMIVVLAGYTAEMEHLLQSNPGLKSRFSYVFHFNDYTPEQLLKIGAFVMKKEQYEITPEAEKKLSQYVINAYSNKDEHFGNGRFITRLLTTKIIPAVSDRLYKMPADSITQKDLITITEEDIPECENKQKLLTWDETIISNALERLDELAGMSNVKQALNDYVVTLRACYVNKTPLTGDDMTWNFLGNTGTGKSTVAEILCCIMQGAGLIPTNHFCTLNIEEFANANNQMGIIEKAMLKATDGMLFLDLDSPNYKNYNMDFLQFWIENKRKELNMNVAVVIAKANSDSDAVARNLVHNGVVPSNHIIVFEDFKLDELQAIFRHLLKKQFGLDITPEAEVVTNQCIEQIYKNRQQFPVNARTMQLLAGTVAQIAQLRIFSNGEKSGFAVVKADTDRLEWNGQSMLYRRIGF
jgi:SpoVK/Ycf46/Vps4 family AAA+-type ATPase/energy-coupling factor transporter ATP-binding protein EcfA2